MLNRFSGHLLYVKGEGQFIFKGESIKAFAWLHPYFYKFILKTNTIGLDSTFRVLKPFKVCIPQCIIQNTGVPLGILVAHSESFKLYSLLFKLLNKIDPTGEIFQLFQQISYITDEHRSLDKLQSIYDLKIYKCFSHLIRTIGSSSALGLLLRDILLCFTEDEFEKSRLKNAYMLKYFNIYDNDSNKNEKRCMKVAETLGIDPKGNEIQMEESYSPLFIRVEKKSSKGNEIQMELELCFFV